MPRARIISSKCIACVKCLLVDKCPSGAVVQIAPGEVPAIDLRYCHGCGDCVNFCPEGAVEIIP